MNDIGKSIFNLQRYQILQTKLNPATTNFIPNDYAYAWYQKLYPLLEENDLHEDLQPYFSITKEQVDEIINYADSEWLEKRYYNFYEYEKYYGCRTNPIMGISRSALILFLDICFYVMDLIKNFGRNYLNQCNILLKPVA